MQLNEIVLKSLEIKIFGNKKQISVKEKSLLLATVMTVVKDLFPRSDLPSNKQMNKAAKYLNDTGDETLNKYINLTKNNKTSEYAEESYVKNVNKRKKNLKTSSISFQIISYFVFLFFVTYLYPPKQDLSLYLLTITILTIMFIISIIITLRINK